MTRERKLERILCIDDDEDILRVAQLCLEHIGGYQVRCFDSPRAALAKLAEGAGEDNPFPDFILLDVMMPDMDGLRTLGYLRALVRLHEVPIAFMSARVQPEEIADYRARGANGVIAKPFDPAQLPQQIGRIWSDFHTEHA